MSAVDRSGPEGAAWLALWSGDDAGAGGFLDAAVAAGIGVEPIVLAGEGLFETMRVVATPGGTAAGAAPVVARVPLLDRHLHRLAASAAAFGLAVPSPEWLRDLVAAVADRAGAADAVLRLTLGRGAGRLRVLAGIRPLVAPPLPLRLAVVAARRHRGDPTAVHKTTSRAFWWHATGAARALGADEAIVLDEHGALAETTNGNLIALLDGQLVTPPLSGPLLPGIGRAVLIEALAGDGGPAVEQRPIAVAELAAAAGLWSTNAVHGARPAACVGGPLVSQVGRSGRGGPGNPMASAAGDRLAAAFAAALRRSHRGCGA